MATSGTVAFRPNVEEIIAESYERCGIDSQTRTGDHARSARRSLNLLFSDWGNRGVHLWKVELDEVALVSGQAAYTVNTDVSDVLEAFISSTSTASNTSTTADVSLTKIDRSAYSALPNKYSVGTPSQYYVSRVKTPIIYLYQTPDLSTYTYLKYYVIKRIEDAGAYTNQADVVYRFLPAMCAGLAYYLAMKKAPERIEAMKLIYEDEIKRALDEDGQRASLYISPQSYYPNVS